jgi:hypothetical protein
MKTQSALTRLQIGSLVTLLTIFNNFLQGNFHLTEKLTSLGNHRQKLSNPKPTTSNDHNFWSAQRNPMFFGALKSSCQGTPLHHSLPNSATQPENKIIEPYGLATSKKRSSLSENVTWKIYYHKTHDENTYSQAKLTTFRESRPMLTKHHSSELH